MRAQIFPLLAQNEPSTGRLSQDLHKGKSTLQEHTQANLPPPHCRHRHHHHPVKTAQCNMQGLQFTITTQLCTFFIADFNLIMTTAFLPTVGNKQTNILLLQDNLLFRFKNFAPSGQLVKLSSSQIASQGCVPSLSLLPQGADYRPPHDGARTWSPPCPPSPHWPPWDVSSLCSASWPGSADVIGGNLLPQSQPVLSSGTDPVYSVPSSS